MEIIHSKKKNNIIIHDYSKEKLFFSDRYDLAWSVEFLEHVEEKYLLNISNTFISCKYAIITAAPPKKGGHHHVNCKNLIYWIEKFKEYNFEYNIYF